jgi:hypothetical protein
MKEEFYIERIVRIIAGSFIVVSLLLAHFHSPYWLWFTGFVGLNLFQSSFHPILPDGHHPCKTGATPFSQG